jgi:hypothetical protein
MKFEFTSRLKPYLLSISLGIGLILLVGLLVGEWFAIRQNLAPNMRAGKPSNADALGPAITLEGLDLPHAHEFKEFVDRPLFMETRRPPPPAPPGPPPKRDPPAPVTFQLMGVLNSPKGLLALVGENKGKYRRLHLKDTIDGWEVKEIRPDRLFLEQNGEKQDIGLIKKRPKPAAEPNQAQHAQPTPAQAQPRQAAPHQNTPTPTGGVDGTIQEPQSPPANPAPQATPTQEPEESNETE